MFLEIRDIKREYLMGELLVSALNGISLDIDHGEFIAVLGPSGSGKTTLLNVIGGIDRPSAGSIVINENGTKTELNKLSEKNLTSYRRNSVGFIFQFYNLVPTLTAFENVELAARLTNGPVEAKLISKDMLTEVGLEGKFNKFPAQLSGGEQQRVSIARALSKNPRILLADEPTGSIDSVTTGNILKLLQKIKKNHNVTILLVTHNVGISYLADKVIYLRDGKIYATSTYDPAKEKEFWLQLTEAPAIETI